MSLVFKMDTRQQSLKFIILFLRQCSLTDTNFSSYNSHLDYNLGQNKMEQQANRTPPPKSRIKLRKSENVLFSYPRSGVGEEDRYKFPFLFCPRYSIGNSGRRMDFALHGVVVFSLWLNQLKSFQILKTNLKLTSCSLWLVYGGGRKGRGKSLWLRRVQTSRLSNPSCIFRSFLIWPNIKYYSFKIFLSVSDWLINITS